MKSRQTRMSHPRPQEPAAPDPSPGRPLETRNRMTLCRCGHSGNKPLCDGTHREIGFREEAFGEDRYGFWR